MCLKNISHLSSLDSVFPNILDSLKFRFKLFGLVLKLIVLIFLTVLAAI